MRFIFPWQLTLVALIVAGCVSDTSRPTDGASRKLPERHLETTTETAAAPEKSKCEDKIGEVQETISPSLPPLPPATQAVVATEMAAPRSNVNEVVMPPSDLGRFLDNNAFVLRWNVLGPFPFDPSKYDSGNLNSVVHHEFVADEKMLDGSQSPPEGTSWQLIRFTPKDSLGQINLARLFDNHPGHAAAYAVTYLYSEKPENNLTLYAGGTGFLKVWINHRLVHAYNRELRQGKWDQDVVHGARLNKGYNLVVVKTVTVAPQWDFFFRFATGDNIPLKFLPR